MRSLDELFAEVTEVVGRIQPELNATLVDSRIEVYGTFVCKSNGDPFDRFDITMNVFPSFPSREPSLWEVGGRIPRTAARHIFPESGKCCLGLWDAWMLKEAVPNFENYIIGPVTSYFVSQSTFEITGNWPFGEQGHSKENMRQTYGEALGLPSTADHVKYLQLFSALIPTGNPMCPCGSGAKFRQCHWPIMREQRRRIPAKTRKEIYKKVA